MVVPVILPRLASIDDDLGYGISEKDKINDKMDDFNHPRMRRAIIVNSLRDSRTDIRFEEGQKDLVSVKTIFEVYSEVQSTDLIDFLTSGWEQWLKLGPSGWDPSGCLAESSTTENPPPFILGNTPLHRIRNQRPSKHVLGKMGYFCTDTCTPVFDDLVQEMCEDAAIIKTAVTRCLAISGVVYALPTHPGHHAAEDSFGGYCYLNHAAACARLLQEKHKKVAILDVDYHCGNGTASIFATDDSVLVVSLHCDPDHEYPFHNGFEDENNKSLCHLPMPPGTDWSTYKETLERGIEKVKSFGASALVLSLGLDTLDGDPCAIRRAGFKLSGSNYKEMGILIGSRLAVPTVVIQEGGYLMESVGQAATDVVTQMSVANNENL